MHTLRRSPATEQTARAALRMRVVSSIAAHATAFVAVWGGTHVPHRTHTASQQHHVTAATMTVAWIPPIAPSPPHSPATPRPAARVKPRVRALAKPRPEIVLPARVAEKSPAPSPAPAKVDADPVAFVPPPSAFQPPPDQQASVVFVGVEDGEWLRWLADRHGFVAFTARHDAVVERVYSVEGEPMPISAVPLAESWALEIDQPERVTALAPMLARERDRASESAMRIRAFALFPASFRDEVAAAIHRAGGAGGAFLVSFSANELHVSAAAVGQVGVR